MEELNKLIAKYREGTASAAELQRLYTLLNEGNPAWKQALEEAFHRAVDEEVSTLSPEADQRVLARLLAATAPVYVAPSPKRLYVKWAAGLAAACAAALVIVYIWPLVSAKKAGNATGYAATLPTDSIFTADATITLSLPDGSAARLMKGSVLRFSRVFGKADRNIQLQGDAFFSVVKNQEFPFTVTCNEIKTTALGTTFRISAPAHNTVQIHLLEGKVSVEPMRNGYTKKIILQPGQVLQVKPANFETVFLQHKTTIPAVATPASHHHAATSTAGGLNFKEETLGNIFSVLSQQYGKNIICADEEVAAYHFTGSFPASGNGLETILRTLCSLNKLSYTISDNNIYIHKQ